MQDLRVELQKEITELRREVMDCRSNIAVIRDIISGQGEMLRGRSTSSNASLPLLRVPPVPSFQESASEVLENPVVAPSPSSAISNISSDSSAFHIGGLMLDSPQTWPTGLPIAGPSGIGRERHQAQGRLSHLISNAHANNNSVRTHVAERFRARTNHYQTTIKCS